ncbi:MAG: hypothetical protein ACNA7W_13125, partial [Pseudomonadales bacterium]
PVRLAAGEIIDLPLLISAPRQALAQPNTAVTIEACAMEAGRCDTEITRFLGPASLPPAAVVPEATP